ncbi:hypothetical protein M1L60_00230 [Actinoplanes sp. TRM 88003]|uniref:Uncharacterized protein n=1 Tax=Paractinoplanes aksuensis TaxID=2939490 RepID=A0ABT1DDY9_9ACTN|nr:hypothetical protein [Actinoplanes aksuensis]MCO8269010.1 hypothetical protein [Actinoplanes aksuensis]
MSEESRLAPETPESEGLLNVSRQSVADLLNGRGDVLENAMRRVRDEARNSEKFAAFGNTP